MKWIGCILLVFLLSACQTGQSEPTAVPNEPSTNLSEMNASESMDGMGNMGIDTSQTTQQYAPLVGGLYEGGQVLFIHTETSDPAVAEMLTEMMGGPEVVLVPELADAPSALLATLYVFTNGIEGHGPFGFQQDVFDSVPGDEAYRPLRNVLLVEWKEGTTPRELRSVAEVLEAEANDEVTISEPGIVVNFPVLVWPGGSR